MVCVLALLDQLTLLMSLTSWLVQWSQTDCMHSFTLLFLFYFPLFFVNKKKYISLHLVCLNGVFNLFLVRLAQVRWRSVTGVWHSCSFVLIHEWSGFILCHSRQQTQNRSKHAEQLQNSEELTGGNSPDSLRETLTFVNCCVRRNITNITEGNLWWIFNYVVLRVNSASSLLFHQYGGR